jgi:hypothetical protein
MFDRHLFTSRSRESDPAFARSPPAFPLPVLNGQPPVVLVFDPEDPAVEIAYERSHQDGPLVRSASRESTLYAIPHLTPVFAASEGKIIYAREHTDGYAITLAHRDGWATYYRRLEHMFVAPTERGSREAKVGRGDILGYIGSRRAELRPLRLELWRCNQHEEYEAIDPLRFLRRWQLMPWSTSSITSPRVP